MGEPIRSDVLKLRHINAPEKLTNLALCSDLDTGKNKRHFEYVLRQQTSLENFEKQNRKV